jgi:hypothetical protein
MSTDQERLDIQAIEDLIRQALGAAKAAGMRIITEHYGDDAYGEMCPLTAAAWLVGTQKPASSRELVTTRFGRTEDWESGFIVGFDALSQDPDGQQGVPMDWAEGFQLGQKFRQEWKQGLWEKDNSLNR